MALKISVIAASELDDGLAGRWQELLALRQDLRSPFYQPGFTRLIAAALPDARIAVLESGSRVVGFFPHHREPWARLSPIGRRLNDYQGLVTEPGLALPASELLRGCNARYMAFDHLPLSQEQLAGHARLRSASPVMELEGGMTAYRARLGAASKKGAAGIFQSVGNARRRIERQIGPLRLALQCHDPAVYERLVQLKSAQFVRTVGARQDPFALPWFNQVLRSVMETDTPGFAGQLSALFAGDRLVACHLGLRSGPVCHIWFITYDHEFSAYSPGLLLLMAMAEAAPSAGLGLFDLGRGDQLYKQRFQTGTVPLGQGAVSRPAWLAEAAMAQQARKQWLKTTILGRAWRARKTLFQPRPQ
ncbi:MAG: GNAT family N-acetyltransferase [Curvibacter sp.]|nr:GNAT family N-acetyltransferase [Curvibacter sp.]